MENTSSPSTEDGHSVKLLRDSLEALEVGLVVEVQNGAQGRLVVLQSNCSDGVAVHILDRVILSLLIIVILAVIGVLAWVQIQEKEEEVLME
jgi:hypothetical protein